MRTVWVVMEDNIDLNLVFGSRFKAMYYVEHHWPDVTLADKDLNDDMWQAIYYDHPDCVGGINIYRRRIR